MTEPPCRQNLVRQIRFLLQGGVEGDQDAVCLRQGPKVRPHFAAFVKCGKAEPVLLSPAKRPQAIDQASSLVQSAFTIRMTSQAHDNT